jgi:type IV secretion system protein VirD4
MISYLGCDGQMGQGITKDVTTKLQIWSNPRVAAATNATDFDLREIRRKPMSVYIGVSPGDIPRNAPLLRLLFDALLSVNTTRTPEQDPTLTVPVLLMLDEFPQLGRMDRLSHAMEYVRGYGIRMILIVQNKPQVADAYGHYAADSIFANVGAEIIYGTADETLAEQVEKRSGNQTVQVATSNRPMWFPSLKWSRQTQGQHPHPRPVLLRQEVLQMPEERFICLRPGMRPILGNKIRWWEEPTLTGRKRPPPVIPELKLSSSSRSAYSPPIAVPVASQTPP